MAEIAEVAEINNDIIYNNLTIDHPKIIQDNKIKIKFKEHQRTAIRAMIDFEETGIVKFTKKAIISNYNIYDKDYYDRYYFYRNHTDILDELKDTKIEIESNYGILADKVGAGKTFMVMGLITYKQVPRERDRILSSSIYTVTRISVCQETLNTNLIIVPHNLTHQWKTTFNYSKIKTLSIMKRSDVDILLFEKNIFIDNPPVSDADYTEINCIEYYDAIIVSATMLDFVVAKFKTTKWARIIIDEIVSIKLPSTMEFNCNFIWFLTATPTGIQYIRRTYIRQLVTGVSNIINNIIIKNNDSYVDDSMNLPNINQIIVRCLTPKEINIIKEYVDVDIINMLNAGNFQDAILKLNCNVETSDNILDVITKKIKKELYNKKTELEYQEKVIPDDEKAHDEKLKRIKSKIESLETQCKTIEDRIKSLKEESCPVCFDDYNTPMLTPCCNNLFCLKCITLCTKCPMCRASLNLKECILIDDNKDANKSDKLDKKDKSSLCSKVDNLIKIIKKNPTGKFLVFSNYDKTFENLNNLLNENKISFNRLVGSNIVINSILRKFESGEIKVLMLNALHYGSGLNLQLATDIIIYHELDQELETQVIGRAQRLGRTQPLNVYYLLNDNEKVNCKNPTLNLDIFADDDTALNNFLNINADANGIPIVDSEDKTQDKDKDQDKYQDQDKDKKVKVVRKRVVKKLVKNNKTAANNDIVDV